MLNCRTCDLLTQQDNKTLGFKHHPLEGAGRIYIYVNMHICPGSATTIFIGCFTSFTILRVRFFHHPKGTTIFLMVIDFQGAYMCIYIYMYVCFYMTQTQYQKSLQNTNTSKNTTYQKTTNHAAPFIWPALSFRSHRKSITKVHHGLNWPLLNYHDSKFQNRFYQRAPAVDTDQLKEWFDRDIAGPTTKTP